jgi:hypothetical protein
MTIICDDRTAAALLAFSNHRDEYEPGYQANVLEKGGQFGKA